MQQLHLPELPETMLTDASMDRCRQLIASRYAHPPMAFIHSFGCQQNISDGEKLVGMLTTLGFGLADSERNADLVLYNTCAVRETAEDRVYGHIGALKNLKKENPDLLIIVCGCMAQRNEVQTKLRESYPYVDIVFGTGAIHLLPGFLAQRLSSRKRVFFDEPSKTVVEDIPVVREKGVRAWLPIMQGCDNFCSYCIVPYVRGREVSRAADRIVAEAKELLQQGYQEITLLGQNVNSYGKGSSDGINFSSLVRLLDKIEGEHWFRFMTSHPKDCTKELIDALASSTHFCKHIHLPVQSGSNAVLQEMNRHYTIEKYMHLIDYARKAIPNVSFSSDIIVGFPTEREEDFLQTFEVVKQVRYNTLFTFIYSRRSGTKAAQMQAVATEAEKSRWFQKLLKEQQTISGEINTALIGSIQRVLFDGISKTPGMITGRTEGNSIVEAKGDEKLIGTFGNVRITKAMNAAIVGEIEN